MARQIQSIIELSNSQTKQFLASFQNPKNSDNRRKTIKKARKTKFLVL